MSPLTLKKSRGSKGSVSKVSLDRRRQERMCSGDALATSHFAQTGKTLLPWLKEQFLRRPLTNLVSAIWSALSQARPMEPPGLLRLYQSWDGGTLHAFKSLFFLME
ncbi:hypothetical protein AVEN_111070-1 [Araneus ventricosus]|uniref:Uncharacterized protein n=1 Tax=Araneus ventricosus TaxID=182803 RepID=A0A4Y2DQM2_ARAVE|nr:hypothetical protein AVEN_111070-1 [Araneus ventricosus]